MVARKIGAKVGKGRKAGTMMGKTWVYGYQARAQAGGRILHHEKGWSRPRRLVVVRHEIKEKKRPGGKKLIEVPGDRSRAESRRAQLSVRRSTKGNRRLG
jgi:hypothetical protein